MTDIQSDQQDADWPIFRTFKQSRSGYLEYLAAWIKRRAEVEDIEAIPSTPLIDHWIAYLKASRRHWPDMEELSDYPDDPGDVEFEAMQRFYDASECVFSVFWDSGGPGMGAEEERIYRWEGEFYYFSEYWEVPNPFKSLDRVLKVSGLLQVNTATQWIRCKLLTAEELIPRLSVSSDLKALEINGDMWQYDSKSNAWSKAQCPRYKVEITQFTVH